MNEKTSTNQEIVNVTLYDNNGVDTLLFEMSDEEGINVNLNETSGQRDLKNVFEMILKKLSSNNLELKLTIDEEYKKGLYKEVCEEYISDLNNEIKAVRSEILSYDM